MTALTIAWKMRTGFILGQMSRAEQGEQVLSYLFLVCAVLNIIGMIGNGYLWVRKSTPEPQRKHSRKVFFVLLIGLVSIALMNLSRILGII